MFHLNEPFIVAEIGNNHLGDVEVAKRLIAMAASCGCSAVKLQKRDNASLYTKTLYNSPYDNEASYGATYGEHREYLEFGRQQYQELIECARGHGIILFATAFDFHSVDFLEEFDVPAYKIASGDLTNIPLIKYVMATGKPMIISTGGGSFIDVHRVIRVAEDEDCMGRLILLHCIASYPNKDEQLNLMAISEMKRIFGVTVGFSSHHPGIEPHILAYMCGARVFEVHITESRANKGTDHGFSLEPQGLRKLCEDLKRIPVMLGDGVKRVLPEEEKPIAKMSKNIYPVRAIRAGEVILPEMITLKSPGTVDGIRPYDINNVIGKTIIMSASTALPLNWRMLK